MSENVDGSRDLPLSAESVGDLGLGDVPEGMIEGDFEGSKGPKAVRFSGSQFGSEVAQGGSTGRCSVPERAEPEATRHEAR